MSLTVTLKEARLCITQGSGWGADDEVYVYATFKDGAGKLQGLAIPVDLDYVHSLVSTLFRKIPKEQQVGIVSTNLRGVVMTPWPKALLGLKSQPQGKVYKSVLEAERAIRNQVEVERARLKSQYEAQMQRLDQLLSDHTPTLQMQEALQ